MITRARGARLLVVSGLLCSVACGPTKVESEPIAHELPAHYAAFVEAVTADYCATMFQCESRAAIRQTYRFTVTGSGEEMEPAGLGLGSPGKDDTDIDELYVWDRQSCLNYIGGLVATEFALNGNWDWTNRRFLEPGSVIDERLPDCREAIKRTCDGFTFITDHERNLDFASSCPDAFPIPIDYDDPQNML